MSDMTTSTFPVDDYDLDAFAKVASGFGQDRYGYVVTPNVDHLIRWHADADFRSFYADASYVLLDSRFLASLMRPVNGGRPLVCTGSDLTERLLSRIVTAQDRIILIGGEEP